MKWTFMVCLPAAMYLAAGCGPSEPEQRQYREVRTAPEPTPAPVSAPQAPQPPLGPAAAPPMAGQASMAAAGAGMTPAVEVSWTTPDGWQEQPGGGARIATFLVEGRECTITAFPGDVGGTIANLQRWLGQIQAQPPAPAALNEFADNAPAFTSRGGLPGRIYDLGDLLPNPQPDTESMLAAILTKQDASVFIKLTAPRSVLEAHHDAFVALCESLE